MFFYLEINITERESERVREERERSCGRENLILISSFPYIITESVSRALLNLEMKYELMKERMKIYVPHSAK